MTVEQLIYDRLLANSTISSIAGTRVFHDYDQSPEDPNALPLAFVVFGLERESESEDVTRTRSWFVSEYSIACVAATSDNKVALANAVKAEMKSLIGTTGDLVIKDSILRDASDQVEDALVAAGLRMRIVFQEIWWVNT